MFSTVCSKNNKKKKKSKNDDLSKVKLPVRVRRLKFVLIFMQSLPSVYTDTGAQAYKQPCSYLHASPIRAPSTS